MKNFHSLRICNLEKDTPEAVKITLEIPNEKASLFAFKAGQYLSFKFNINAQEVRRSYSICDAPSEKLSQVSVLVKHLENGLVSTFLTQVAKENDVLEVMPPMGGFQPILHPNNARTYFGLAAGSGISPILSNIKEILAQEPKSQVYLFFGSKNQSSVLRQKELEDLQSSYHQRLKIIYVLSREKTNNGFLEGRISPELLQTYFEKQPHLALSESYFMICGPSEMIKSCSDYLKKDLKIPAIQVMYEYFSSPDEEGQEEMSEEFKAIPNLESMVTLIIDDDEYSFHLNSKKESILDKALKDKLPVPFACKGGVCCTCKAQVMEGEVFMEKNYALTEDEVAKGFVLSCQCHPTTNVVMLNFDV